MRLLRYLTRRLRSVPDRLLHGRRRRRALERLRASFVRSVVFVCHGNINRSAYAAAAFARSAAAAGRGDVVIASAGFIGPGRPASAQASALAIRRGVDLSTHRSRLLDDVDLMDTDLIVVMNADQARDIARRNGVTDRILVLGDLDPQRIDRRAIQDPYGHPDDVFERVFDRLDRCLSVLSDALWSR